MWHGEGTCYYAPGEYYYGKFIMGIKHGNGIFSRSSGNKYMGTWINNKAEGKMEIIEREGDKRIEYYHEGRIIKNC